MANETAPAVEALKEAPTKFLQLANAEISFVDPETGFRLVTDQVAECPVVGKLTAEWLRAGGIREVAQPVAPKGKGK